MILFMDVLWFSSLCKWTRYILSCKAVFISGQEFHQTISSNHSLAWSPATLTSMSSLLSSSYRPLSAQISPYLKRMTTIIWFTEWIKCLGSMNRCRHLKRLLAYLRGSFAMSLTMKNRWSLRRLTSILPEKYTSTAKRKLSSLL